ncbi:MAG TPA: hypothetical protein VLA75_12720 [Thermoanaerobaculia bacterium]|nr:hypothetical protein [Thermoanaerobaculia bacterium]
MTVRSGRRRFAGAAAALALAAALLACGGGGGRRERGPGSAAWESPAAQPLAAGIEERLRAVGVEERFLEAGWLEGAGGAVRLAKAPLARRAAGGRTTLVVRGAAPEGEAVPRALATELRSLLAEADGRGLRPAGIHLDLEPFPAPSRLFELLGPLRETLPGDRLLSITVPRAALGDRELARLADLTDFWVVFLFGQRPGEREDLAYWDFYRTEQDARRVEEIGEPFLLGVSTLAALSRLDARGEVREERTAFHLFPLLAHRSLEMVPGSLLLGVDRQVVELRTRGRLAVEGWSLEPRERLRMVRAPVHLVEELERLAGSWGLARHLGQLYFRLPEPGEVLSLSGAAIAAALEPGPATPELRAEVESLPAPRGRFRFRIRLRNASDLATEIATLEHNFVALAVPGARVAEVELGEFVRYDLARSDARGERRGVLRADEVRLFAPIVEGGAELESGPIELVAGGGTVRVRVALDFLLPDGRVFSPPAEEWEIGG